VATLFIVGMLCLSPSIGATQVNTADNTTNSSTDFVENEVWDDGSEWSRGTVGTGVYHQNGSLQLRKTGDYTSHQLPKGNIRDYTGFMTHNDDIYLTGSNTSTGTNYVYIVNTTTWETEEKFDITGTVNNPSDIGRLSGDIVVVGGSVERYNSTTLSHKGTIYSKSAQKIIENVGWGYSPFVRNGVLGGYIGGFPPQDSAYESVSNSQYNFAGVYEYNKDVYAQTRSGKTVAYSSGDFYTSDAGEITELNFTGDDLTRFNNVWTTFNKTNNSVRVFGYGQSTYHTDWRKFNSTTAIQQIDFNVSRPGETSISLEIQTSDDGETVKDSVPVNFFTEEDTYNISGELESAEYVRLEVSMVPDGDITPKVHSIGLNTQHTRPVMGANGDLSFVVNGSSPEGITNFSRSLVGGNYQNITNVKFHSSSAAEITLKEMNTEAWYQETAVEFVASMESGALNTTITGLVPNAYYQVYEDGTVVENVTTDANGTFSYTKVGGWSEHRITVKRATTDTNDEESSSSTTTDSDSNESDTGDTVLPGDECQSYPVIGCLTSTKLAGAGGTVLLLVVGGYYWRQKS